MRVHILSLLALGLFVTVGFVRSDDAKKAKFDGVWKLVKGEQNGEDIPDEALKTGKMEIKGEMFTFKLAEFEGEGKLKIDLSKTPPTVDAEMTGGQAAGQTYPGIMEVVDEDSIKQCYADPGQDRPTKFTTKEGSGRFVFVWKREKKAEK
jgi:uncharacterized protein (TIGR03067 family)